MKYVVYGGYFGDLKTCLKNKKYHFESIYEMFNFLVLEGSRENGVPCFGFHDLSLKYHCYSSTFETDVYMICTNRFYNEDLIAKYGTSQWHRYCICIDDPELDTREKIKRMLRN